jgi:hypothetical protein
MSQVTGTAATVLAVNTNTLPQEPPEPAALAALPNPETTLEHARAKYPGVSEAVLRGERSFQILSGRANVARPAGLDLTQVTPLSLGTESGQVALMPLAGVRGGNAAEKQARIVAYVNEGQALYEQIMNGTVERSPHGKEDLAKLMWYMQALASSKAARSSGGEGLALYREGGLFLEDPDRRLENFLLNSNSYTRSSSHLLGFQSQGPEYRPHGVDVRKVETPNERRTILFQRIPPQQTVGGVKHMLFFKMEEHGCRGLSAKGTGRGDLPVSTWHSLKRFLSNIKDIIGHALTFSTSVRQRRGNLAITGQNNRERVPSEVAQSYAALITRAGIMTDATRAAMIRILERDNPHLGDTGGIRGMIANLEAALAVGKAQSPQDPIVRDCQNLLYWLQRRGDHIELRIGNEVILTGEEMIGQAAPLIPLARAGVGTAVNNEAQMSETGYGALLAGYQYQIDAMPPAHELDEQGDDQFSKDMNRDTLRIGVPGTERIIIKNGGQAAEALRNLTTELPGGERVEQALRLVCNQALPLNILAQCMDASKVQLGLSISPGNSFSGEYAIIRRQDGDDAVFTVSSQISGIASTAISYLPEHAAQGGQVQLDLDRSRLDMHMALDVRVKPNGSITVEESSDRASFAYSVAFNDDALRADRRAAMELALQFALADFDPQNPTAANGALRELTLPGESNLQPDDITRLREEISRRVTEAGEDAASGSNQFSREMTPSRIQTIMDETLAQYAALLGQVHGAPLGADAKSALQGRIFAKDNGLASPEDMQAAVANDRTIEATAALRARMRDLAPEAPLLRILAEELDKANTGLTMADIPDKFRQGLAGEMDIAILKKVGLDPRHVRSVSRQESEELAATICRTFAEGYQAAGQNPMYSGFFQPALLRGRPSFDVRYVEVLLGQAASLAGQALEALGAAGNPKDILKAVDAFNTMLGGAKIQAGKPESEGGFGLKLGDSLAATNYLYFMNGLKVEELDAAQTERVRSALFDGDWLGPLMRGLEFAQNRSNDEKMIDDATALIGALGALRQAIGDKLNIAQNEIDALKDVFNTSQPLAKLDDLPPEIRELWPW